jgi:Tfp pilus assembly protein PilF
MTSDAANPPPTTRPPDSPPPGRPRGADLATAAVLALGSFLLYFPSLSNHFVDYDDHHYVTANKVVQQGLTRQGLIWAFTTTKFANWLPVTWLSHMLDCELFGLNARGHHATSAALHGFNAAALFIALRMMTGRFRPAVAVAALFVVHPLRVESVSWVAERKDILCGTFFMLALLAYTAYSKTPTFWRYTVVFACHMLGLMSKTMLVTLPCVLLLLDYWPLRRMRLGGDLGGVGDPGDSDAPPFIPPRPLPWLIAEKLPLLLLSVISSAWTVRFQSGGGAMWGERDLTLSQRVANAVVSVPRYLQKITWPTDLSVFYPHPGSWPLGRVVVATVIVLLLSLAAAAVYRRRPYVTVGWFWFLGMLVPVSGIVQVGLQSMADRYTYLPGIGLLVAIVWWLSDALRPRPRLVAPVAALFLVVLGVLSVLTWRQQRHWENTLTLFEQAARADPNNWLAHNMIGSAYSAAADRAFSAGNRQRGAELAQVAVDRFEKSVAARPDHFQTRHNYAWTLYYLGRLDEAERQFRESIRIKPDWGYSHLDLGVLLTKRGRGDEALPLLEEAVRLQPNDANVRTEVAEAMLTLGRRDDAVQHLDHALRIRPGHDRARQLLAAAAAPPLTVPATVPASAPATTPPAQ